MARPDPTPLVVRATESLGRRTKRIEFSGTIRVDQLRPASYLSLWFSDPAVIAREPRTGRTDKRSFTPRFIDPLRGTMTIDFVLHGSGPASTWAADAESGDKIWAGPVKGGFAAPESLRFLVLIGDDTAMPAIGTILEAIAPDVGTCVIVEVVDDQDERQLSTQRTVDPIWLHRGDDPGRTGQATLNLEREIQVPDDAFWWIAGEREAIRAIRDVLVEERGIDRQHYSLNAYWRLTETDPRTRS